MFIKINNYQNKVAYILSLELEYVKKILEIKLANMTILIYSQSINNANNGLICDVEIDLQEQLLTQPNKIS